MEDFAEYLVKQAKSDSAALHEFMLRFTEKSSDIHLFFEGDEDPSFYMPSVRARMLNRTGWTYICGGKPALIKLRNELVKRKYPLGTTLFFVDRDLDDFLGCQVSGEPRTFITDPYSIENYLVGRYQAEIVLVDLCGLSQTDHDCKKFLASIDNTLLHCAKRTLPFIAMTLAARESGVNANFQNLNLNNVFAISLNPSSIRRKSGAAAVCRSAVLPKEASVAFRDTLRWARVLSASNVKLWFRGKYELWFFERILILFLEQVRAKRSANKQKSVRIPASLREGRLFEALGGRIGPISSLEDFLSRNM